MVAQYTALLPFHMQQQSVMGNTISWISFLFYALQYAADSVEE